MKTAPSLPPALGAPPNSLRPLPPPLQPPNRCTFLPTALSTWERLSPWREKGNPQPYPQLATGATGLELPQVESPPAKRQLDPPRSATPLSSSRPLPGLPSAFLVQLV